MNCYLCNDAPREKYFGYFCKDGYRLYTIIKTYGKDRVVEICENVLIRTESQQINKIKNELEVETKKLEDNKIKVNETLKELRSGRKVVTFSEDI